MACLLSTPVAVVPRKRPRIRGPSVFFCGLSDGALGTGEIVLCGWAAAACLISSSVAPSSSSSWWRDAGREGAFAREVGGGGKGEALASPMRRRVKVTCAFVGIPLRRVL